MKYFIIFLLLTAPLLGVTVDLREPTYEDGILRTDKGGVIEAENIRIQAIEMVYTRNGDIDQVEAEGDLMIEFGNHTFVGRRLEFDLKENRGIVYDGRTGFEPWFLGGKEIHLCPDGSYLIYGGFATTSENVCSEWQINTEAALLRRNCQLTAKNVCFRVVRLPLLWVPRFNMNLNTIFDHPIKYTVRLGGRQGPRIGLRYSLFSWYNFKTFLRLDYYMKRGPGGGIETKWKSLSGNQHLHTVNYTTDGITRFNGDGTTRYRFMGVYDGYFDSNRTSVHLTWDKLSDKDMATDYDDKGLKLETGKRTQLHVRRQECDWIANFLFRYRVNDFQTVKQELPTLAGNFRPLILGRSGIIAENAFKFSYLELEYRDEDTDVSDYNSPRFELSTRLYRPFTFGQFNFTPEIAGVAIYYGNNPEKRERWMNIGYVGGELNTNLHRFYGPYKHTITPYIRYNYWTYPSTTPNNHYIFDLDDGWFKLNMLKIGFEQSLYTKYCGDCIYRKFYSDFWFNAFFDTPTIDSSLPKVYGRFVYNPTYRIRSIFSTAWDFREGILDHANYRIEWTLSEKAAVATEYRYRSSFDWRKVDHNNFFLDSFKDVDELRDSAVSDRRDTLLLHLYYRFHPYWALQFHSRHGWGRLKQPNYNEYQVDLLGTIRSSWHVRFFYRHREDDDRFSINFSIGLKRPCSPCTAPCLEF